MTKKDLENEIEELKAELKEIKIKYYYYFKGNKEKTEQNYILRGENKRLKRENLELSYLVTELMKKKKRRNKSKNE